VTATITSSVAANEIYVLGFGVTSSSVVLRLLPLTGVGR
jgi:hypothetical protein